MRSERYQFRSVFCAATRILKYLTSAFESERRRSEQFGDDDNEPVSIVCVFCNKYIILYLLIIYLFICFFTLQCLRDLMTFEEEEEEALLAAADTAEAATPAAAASSTRAEVEINRHPNSGK